MSDYITESLVRTKQTIITLAEDKTLLKTLQETVDLVIKCFNHNGKVMFAGNGGSAADAQHMSAEFVARFNFDRPGLCALALTTDTSALTAIGNDYGFEYLFSRQIEALGKSNDIFIAYSTSGKSLNILKALEQAKSQDITTIGLTGNGKSSETMHAFCDILLQVPSSLTPHIQECHLVLGHLLCGAVEQQLFGAPKLNDK